MMESFFIKYYLLYFIFFSIAVAFAFQVDFKKHLSVFNVSQTILHVFVFLFIVLIGLRGINIGTDTRNYLAQFEIYQSYFYGSDILMFCIYAILNQLHLPFHSFLLLMSFLYIGTLIVSIKKNSTIFSSNALLIFFAYLSLFFFSNLGVNIIRQGVSLSFLLLFIVNFQDSNEKSTSWIIPAILSILFHITSAIPILIYFLIVMISRIPLFYYYLFYILSIFFSFFGQGILLLEEYITFLLVDDRRLEYLNDTSNVYQVGFRPEFIVFNSIFLIAFLFIKSYLVNNNYYNSLVKYYLIMSGIFFMTFQIPYSDRWGLMSWIVIPIMLSPFFSVYMPRKLATISIFSLGIIFVFFEIYF